MNRQNVAVIDNGVDLEVLNKTIKAIQENKQLGQSRFRARNIWISGGHNASTIREFYTVGQERAHGQSFELHADEPPLLGGTDKGANPVEHLLNALAGCVTTAMVAHAAVRGIEINSLESELEGDIDLRGFLGLDEKTPKGFTNIRIKFKVDADPANLDKLKKLAMFSPVYNTIIQGAAVDIQIEHK
jgi:uncharacterized OsmC-like protein